jgi:CRP/FNR family cyclic AMP-dependent transcriptional regulator
MRTSLALASLVGAGWAKAWLIPGLLGALVVGAVWVGLRWAYAEHMAGLRTVPLFTGLSPRQLRSVARAARRVEYPPGQVVTREGENGNSLFVIERGTAKVTAQGEHKATLGAGGYFGEVAVIDGGPRTATITAEIPLAAIEVPSGPFLRLLDGDEAFSRAVVGSLRTVVRNAGGAVPEEGGAAVDHATLIDLCRRLREVQTPDWAQSSTTPRRWMGLAIPRRR